MARSFSLIGPGRAGLSVAAALETVGWAHLATFGRGTELADAALGVDLCVIATPDSAIPDVAAQIDVTEAVVLHLSGAQPLTTLGRHRKAALHPLVSLAEPETGAEKLRTAWFAVAGDPLAADIADQLSGKWFPIADDDRALYHATASVAANHLTALLGQVERMAGEVDVPFQAFLELARGSLDNVERLGATDALTGPAARGDEATIAAHLEALLHRLPDEVRTYEALVAEARRLAGGDPRAH